MKQAMPMRRKRQKNRSSALLAALLLAAAMVSGAAAEGLPAGTTETISPVIVISEVLAGNDTVATYPGAEKSDYIELFNTGAETVDLGGWGLSDKPDKPMKWQFPAGTLICPGEYKVILCDNNAAKSTAGELHTNFKIGKTDRDTIVLTDAAGNIHDRLQLPELKQDDMSYGRDLSGSLSYFDTPTPFRANENGFAGYAAKPSFSVNPGFWYEPQFVRIIAAEGTRVYYTTDGLEPTQESYPYNGETFQINHTTVVRARAFGEGTARPSDILTGTFFINAYHGLPVVSVTVDPKNLYDPEWGMLTVGNNVVKEAGKLPFRNTVYRKVKDAGIKYGSYVEMYDDAGMPLLSQGAEISLSGDYSLDMPQKSFKFRAKSAYGGSTFKAKLFPDREYTEYEGFILRNSGNDCMWTRLADGYISRLMDFCGTTVAHQAWKPYVVYLNGVYWGHKNLRARGDKYMIAQYEGLDFGAADGIDLLQGGGSVKNGSNKAYKEMIKKIKAGKPAKNQADLQYILDNVDVDNYLEFMAFEMFFGNSDIGNVQFYNTNTPGSKWKCLAHDMDYGLFDSGFDSPKSFTKSKGMGQMNVDNTIFLKLLSVPEYRDRFLTIYGEIFRKLTTENMMAVLDEMVGLIGPEMEMHWARWGEFNDKYVISEVPTTAEGAYKYWQKRVDRLRNVIKKRPTRLWEFTKKAFKLKDAEMVKYFGEKPPMPADAI